MITDDADAEPLDAIRGWDLTLRPAFQQPILQLCCVPLRMSIEEHGGHGEQASVNSTAAGFHTICKRALCSQSTQRRAGSSTHTASEGIPGTVRGPIALPLLAQAALRAHPAA